MRKENRWLGTLLAAVFLLTVMTERIPAQELTVAEVEASQTDECDGYRQLRLVDVGELQEAPVSRAQYGTSTSEYWNAFGSDYFYEQMNSQEQAFYDKLYVAAMNLLTGSQDADVVNINGENYYHMPYVSGGSLNKDEACWVATIFQISNPQFYFISDAMCWGYNAYGIQFGLCLYEDFADGAVRSGYTEQLRSVVNGLLQQVNAQTDPVSKEKKAHDLIAERTSYGYGTYNQSCAGVFFENKAVCAGYAEAFALLCNGAGLETISVTSTTHEWNKVKLYGRWYVVDCTWDDSESGISYDYFNVTDAYVWRMDTDHVLESSWSGYNVPYCVNDTVVQKGIYIYNGIDYSDVFDEYYYVERYADMKANFGSDWEAALKHFVEHGMQEGRQANGNFDVYAYRARYKDLRMTFGSDLKSYYLHYINFGKKEGRVATGSHAITSGVTCYNGVDYSAVYDYNYYVSKYPDMVRTFGDDDVAILAHFVNHGMEEGRQAKEDFNVYTYRRRYKDLRQNFGYDLEAYYLHYMNHGKAEKRIGNGTVERLDGVSVYNGVDYSAVYDYTYYVNRYPDIARTFGEDDIAVLRHFVNHGMEEGRQGSADFNPQTYRQKYQDLDATFGNDNKSYFLHYLNHGISEGRTT